MNPNASRETLDHSIMYIFAVALEDGNWHNVKSYTKKRSNRKNTIKIWKSIKTHEDKKWTKKYHNPNPKNKSFGAKVVVTMSNGKKILEQLDKADAHPYGLRPFKRQNYIKKFLTLTNDIINKRESSRFLKVVQNLKNLKSGELNKLNIEVKRSQIKKNLKDIKKIDIYTSHHTHFVIGTGANDPQKMNPNASRETLDHSIMYIFAVALEDGNWHHIKSYTKKRANRKSTIKICKSIKTHEDKRWTKKYHDPNPKNKSFGAKVLITLRNGKKIT